jgi:hypothetical protein
VPRQPIRLRWLAIAALAAALSACSQGAAITPSGPATAANAGKAVTFTVSVDAKAFSDKSPITVRIWDETQRQIQDETSQCSVSMDMASGKETISCPAGVTYRKATPEEFQITKADLAKGLTIVSTSVTVGERYMRSVTGKAADDCNTASASSTGTATGTTMTLANLEVASTLMACIPAY